MKPEFAQIFFDVDSTLVTIEGIDVLARDNDEVASLTERAMSGEIAIEEVYRRRLEIIRPSRADIDDLGRLYLENLVPGTEELFELLQGHLVDVHLVTAGIEQAIAPLATRLGVRRGAVHAVPLTFDDSGKWIGYDETALPARRGGKELVVRNVRARSKGRAAYVGDGATDLEARRHVDLFIGFGGVAVRQTVRDNADVWIDVPDLRALIPHLFEETP